MARFFRLEGCLLVINLDRINVVDVHEVSGKWCVGLFFTGGSDPYTICLGDKKKADSFYNMIVKAIEV